MNSFNSINLNNPFKKFSMNYEKIDEKINEKIDEKIDEKINEKIDETNEYRSFLPKIIQQLPLSQVKRQTRLILWELSFKNSLDGTCYVCNSKLTYHNFHAGHIISKKDGGSNSLTNLKVICSGCNYSMSSENLYQFKNSQFPEINPIVKKILWESHYPLTSTGKCFICSQEVNYSNFFPQRIISKKNGGTDNVNNLEITCLHCFSFIGDSNLPDFKRKYID